MRSLAALGATALALAGHAHGWIVEYPPCPTEFKPFTYSGCYAAVSNPSTLSFRSDADRNTMTVEKCQAVCKGNGYRYAGLEYYGVCTCGSSINAAKVAESECNLGCAGNNSQTCGGNNAYSVYEDPTFPPAEATTVDSYQSVGCYVSNSATDDSKTLAYPAQDVTGQTWDRNTGTNAKCIETCHAKGFPYAGTEFGGECWCGVTIAQGSVAAPASECNMACLGAPSEICGGSGRVSVFHAEGLESDEACGSQPPTTPTAPATTPATTPVTTPVTTPDTTPVTTPETTPVTTPETTPVTTPETTPVTTPETTPVTTPSSPVTTPTAPVTTPITSPPTTAPPTTTKPPTTTTATTSSAVCVTTIVTPPKCEYKCGNWCSGELPDWTEPEGCKNGFSYCKLQVAACFKNAGWPGVVDCFGFSAWCTAGSLYCITTPKNKCSKVDWFKQKPPVWGPGGKPSTTTVTVPCTATSTTVKTTTTAKTTKTTTTTKPPATTTTKCPIPPTATNICKQPSNIFLGYGPGKPVGGIELPLVTCNDLRADHPTKPWKMYNDADTRKCVGYPSSGVPNACKDACKEQYDDCVNVYAEGCRQKGNGGFPGASWPWKRSLAGRTWGWVDTWQSAKDKCKSQYNDCLAVNKFVAANGKCYGFGVGW